MNTTVRLAAYGVVLALIAGSAWIVGSIVGPLSTESTPAGHSEASSTEHEHADNHSKTPAEAEQHQPAGLASSQGGYTFAPTTTTLAAGTNSSSFRILGPNSDPVTAFDMAHDKQMHLVVVRRDSAEFQHVHPDMATDGTWSVPLSLTQAGSYRMFADFAPTSGAATTLGADVSVPGIFEPRIYSPSRASEVDGYQVRVDGELSPGKASPIEITINKDGKPITDLQPYLGAYGHLVALRQSDLAYLHVHPNGIPGGEKVTAGPKIAFTAQVPTAGSYRLFLDFQHHGVVRTAEFTVNAKGNQASPAPHTEPHPQEGHSGHGG